MRTTHKKLTALLMGVVMTVCCILLTVFPVFAADGDDVPAEKETITVTFYDGDEIYGEPQIYEKDAEVKLPANYPTHTDKVFLSWSRTSGGLVTYLLPGGTASFSEDTKLTAHYGDAASGSEGVYAIPKEDTHSTTAYRVYDGTTQTVEFIANKSGETYSQKYMENGTTIDGVFHRFFQFDQTNLLVSTGDWYVDITGLSASGKDVGEYKTTPVSGAEWCEVTWIIGGSITFSKVNDKFIQIAPGTLQITPRPLLIKTADVDVRFGDIIPTEDNTVEGVVDGESIGFAELTADQVGKEQDNKYELAPDANTKLSNYSIEEELGKLDVYYEITYDVNGGTGTFDPQKAYEASAVLSADEPTKENNKFLGWATSAEATKAEYQAGDTIELNDNTTLYAVWEEVKKDVSPKTGDSANSMLYAGLCGISLATIVTLLVLRRRKHQ